jgi:hypothetical protein
VRVIRLFGILTLLVGLGAVLAVLGYQSTKLLVSEGVERFTGAKRAAAEEALVDAQLQCRDHPIGPLMIPKIRVVEVQFAPECCATALALSTRNYLVVLKAYTFFVIPVTTIVVCGGAVVCGGGVIDCLPWLSTGGTEDPSGTWSPLWVGGPFVLGPLFLSVPVESH